MVAGSGLLTLVCSVVHVASRCTEQELLEIGDAPRLPRPYQREREFEFRFELSSVLLGDFTENALEREARRLLRAVSAVRGENNPVSGYIIPIEKRRPLASSPRQRLTQASK